MGDIIYWRPPLQILGDVSPRPPRFTHLSSPQIDIDDELELVWMWFWAPNAEGQMERAMG